jgi:hypothetical protein
MPLPNLSHIAMTRKILNTFIAITLFLGFGILASWCVVKTIRNSYIYLTGEKVEGTISGANYTHHSTGLFNYYEFDYAFQVDGSTYLSSDHAVYWIDPKETPIIVHYLTKDPNSSVANFPITNLVETLLSILLTLFPPWLLIKSAFKFGRRV